MLTDSEQRFTRTVAGLKAAVRLEAAAALDEVQFEEADYELLKAACTEPSCGYPLAPARLNLPFIDAILNAT
jgi:hypothetical protein